MNGEMHTKAIEADLVALGFDQKDARRLGVVVANAVGASSATFRRCIAVLMSKMKAGQLAAARKDFAGMRRSDSAPPEASACWLCGAQIPAKEGTRP